MFNVDYIFAANKKKNKKINKNKIKVNERGKITPLLSVLFKWKIYNRFDGD